MYKIFLSVRNRLAITIKCITAITKHSKLPYSLYIYDNESNVNIRERFLSYAMLYEKGIISQVTFNTTESSFKAFSKVTACNDFGMHHQMDPKKDLYDFLIFLDNDIIVFPGWDEIFRNAWSDVRRIGLSNIKVIGQNPGGIKFRKEIPQKIAGFRASTGRFGGSALWAVRPNFFKEVGYLDVSKFIGYHKRHDQEYWEKLDHVASGQDYILGINTTIGVHCGKYAGSICNILSRTKDDTLIDFKKQEEEINKLSFDEFFAKVSTDKALIKDW